LLSRSSRQSARCRGKVGDTLPAERQIGRGGESPGHTRPRETRAAVEHCAAGEKTEHGG